MAKYRPVDIQKMAQEALAAEARHDPRWLVLVVNLALRTGLSKKTVVMKIARLAHNTPQ